MPGVAALDVATVRQALRHLGVADPPQQRATAARVLRESLGGYGTVRSVIDRGPELARQAFVRLAQDGPAPVEDLIGRGWWGRGTLPPPLDWLQRRALILVGDDGLVHATDEARAGFGNLTLPLEPVAEPPASQPLRVESAQSVVLAPGQSALDRAVAVEAAQLRIVAPTVAVSPLSSEALLAVLAESGIALQEAAVASADPDEPALPGTVEQAVGPRAVRTLIGRALDEGRQLHLTYFPSSRGGAATERVVDPWSFADDLLVGYCHLRSGERTFAVDRIGRLQLLAEAIDHPRT